MRGDIVLFLGLVGIIIIVVVVSAMIALGGGGGSSCDSPLHPLDGSDIDQLSFQTEDVGLARVIQAASAGDLTAAQQAFSGDVHNFTHDVDQPLREVDEELAKELCEAVRQLEEEMPEGRVSVIAGQATRIRELLQDAAQALGFARPGG